MHTSWPNRRPVPARHPRADLLEIAEAVVLALIAVATAWSGYQAARWDGHQAVLYGTSARLRVEAAVAATEGGQHRLLDHMTLISWIKAQETKDERLAPPTCTDSAPRPHCIRGLAQDGTVHEGGCAARPRLHARVPQRPAGKVAELDKEATTAFTEGTEAREKSERYVRATVLLATVLFLVALAQRFKIRKVRVALLFVATALLIYALANVATYPRL